MWDILKDSNGNVKMISMTAGDTPSFKVWCGVKNELGEIEEYIPEENDEFVFACKKDRTDTEYLFKIEIPVDTMVVRFKEAHTKNLPTGKYIWEISLNKPDIDYHCTFICEKILQITTEVY